MKSSRQAVTSATDINIVALPLYASSTIMIEKKIFFFFGLYEIGQTNETGPERYVNNFGNMALLLL